MPDPNHNRDGELESCTVCAAVHERAVLEQIRRDLIKLAEPFVKMKCDNGRTMETIYDPDTTEAALKHVDRLWEEARDAFLDQTVLGRGRNPWRNSYLNS